MFEVRRAGIETFARELEALGRARATVTRRLCTIAGFYRYAVEEELLGHSPAAHVRRPRLDYESHATALDRNELGALLVAAGLGPPAEHALISLPALNGLRVSEATGADIEHLGLERGHRTLVITRKGGKVVTIPLAPRTARAPNRPRNRPGGRRAHRRAALRRWRRAEAGPARRRPGRPPGDPPRRHRDLRPRARGPRPARATVTRRLRTIAGFYKYAVEEELLEHSPAAHVRRPRLDYESHATTLDRNELGALLVAAGLGQLPSTRSSLLAQIGRAHV